MLVTCAALVAALSNPTGGGTYRLTEDCRSTRAGAPAFLLRTPFARPVTVEAPGRTVAGVFIDGGGNLIWKGGTIEAPSGSGKESTRGSPAFYGVRMTKGARSVSFENVTFTNARKAVVFGDGSSGLTIRHSRCEGEVEDCLIAADGSDVDFSHNVVGPFQIKKRACTLPGRMIADLSARDCQSQGGTWQDGWHNDVVQLRHGVTNVRASFNVINTIGQGLTQMDRAIDNPIRNVHFHDNKIRAGRHGLTLGRCEGCLIENNTLETAVPGWRAVILPGQAKACGNKVPSGGAGRERC